MPSSILLVLTIFGYSASTLVLVYGAYWALAIRRGLFVGVYRGQALWLAFLTLYFGFFTSSAVDFAQASSNPYLNFLGSLYYLLLALALFRLVDTDIRVARQSDPRLRNTLRWSQLRLAVGAFMATSIILVVYFQLEGYLVPGFDFPQAITLAVEASVFLPFLVLGGAALLVSARRSGDSTLRRSLKWFGLFFLALLATNVSFFATTSGLVQIPSDIFDALSGPVFLPTTYCLYKSARSLAPVGRVLLSDVA